MGYSGVRFLLLCCAASLLWITASCARPNPIEPPGPTSTALLDGSHIDARGYRLIPLREAAHALGLRMEDRDQFVRIGYTDVIYELYPGRPEALSSGQAVTLPQAPVRLKGAPFATVESLSMLLQAPVQWNPERQTLDIGAIRNAGQTPAPPAGGSSSRGLHMAGTGVDTQALIQYAKTFLGVPYQFGAAPYEESKKFDCSSFTQHVFAHFGIKLPRVAQDQAKQGSAVTRDNLQPGDLIFFTVPGRFEDDRIPGHVGISIGNGKFIHTWGDPGVQISDVDGGHWGSVRLSIRRVL
ncbi:MAG: NlpC/P60 family protein [Paenibacillus dendritiformis]|uniref:C40 family peptidase n=1 Tax=Paenibacillus dendritiformis TaxID=130049 RepID=UPI00143D4DF4|nr:NlpC/P60 family protein [Paenibacillus dendritiformis]MDU5140819.1 NlpC/P60 family protein [Paenibacillus dendritiformis]NKI21904.1 NlpC/P60 family protein [Paenibacillus dendritiformis]NRF99359.1 C40 family peptidase [Paenibacillus dendritiformis]